MVRVLGHPNNVLVSMRIIEILTHIFSCGLKAIKLGLIAIEDCDSDNVKSNVFPFNIQSIISSFNMAEIYRF